MSQLFKRKMWMRVMAVVLAVALNLGALDGIINGTLKLANNIGLTDSLHKFNSVPNAYADPGIGSFSPGVFDPNHDETSTLSFKFDYDHDTKVELYKNGDLVKRLEDDVFYAGQWTDGDSKLNGDPASGIVNQYTWNGKAGNGEPMDDGVYTITLTPLDEYSIYPLDAGVTVRNIPHTPEIKGITINQKNGLISIYGTSQPGNVIHLSDLGSYIFSTTADANGNWWIYNRSFTKEKKHVITAKAENQARHWPTLSAPSTAKTFLTYQIKAGDSLSDIANYYLRDGGRYGEIKAATGIQGEDYTHNRIYASNWLLIMNPLREGAFNKPGKTVPVMNQKENGSPKLEMGDPINSVTGNYYTSQTDLFIPGRGLSFDFTRSYNTQSDYRGHLGFRRDFSLNRRLIFYEDGTVGHQRGDGGIDLYTPDSSGNLTAPKGVYDVLKQKDDGTYYLTRKDRTVYNFDGSGRLTGEVDRNDNAIAITYKDNGQINYVLDTAGRRINFVYDDEQRITEISDPQGRKVKYDYDEKGDLVAVTDVDGGITRYEYDDNHNILKSTDPKGFIIIENTYDEEGRVKTQKDAKGSTSYYSYDPTARRTTYTNNKGVTNLFEYNEEFLPAVQTRTLDNTRETVVYDESGHRQSVTDYNGNTTYFGYDSKGNLTGIKDPLGKTTILNYDSDNNLTSVVDAGGGVTYYHYDAKGNLTNKIDALGNSGKYYYNIYGQLEKAIDYQGNETKIEHDSQGNITKVTDAGGNTTGFEYDGVGRVTGVKDARGNSTHSNITIPAG